MVEFGFISTVVCNIYWNYCGLWELCWYRNNRNFGGRGWNVSGQRVGPRPTRHWVGAPHRGPIPNTAPGACTELASSPAMTIWNRYEVFKMFLISPSNDNNCFDIPLALIKIQRQDVMKLKYNYFTSVTWGKNT